MAIKTFRQAVEDQDALAINSTNYPALKHFFPCNESSGLTLTDVLGGVTITMGTSLAKTDGYVVPVGSTTVSGTWSDLTGSALMLVCGDFGPAGYFTIGTPGPSSPFAAFTVAAGSVCKDSSNNAASSIDAFSNSATFMYETQFDFNNAATGYNSFESSATARTTVETPAVNISALTGGIDVSGNPNLGEISGCNKLYSISIWNFASGYPSDIAAAVQWMRYYHTDGDNNHKVLYPGWVGRT